MCKNTEYKNVCEIGRLKVEVSWLTVACKNKDEYIGKLLVSKTTLESAVSSGSNLLHDLRDEIDGRDRTIERLELSVKEKDSAITGYAKQNSLLRERRDDISSVNYANLLKVDVLTKEIASLDETWGKRVRLAQDETDRYSKKNVKLIKRNVTLSRQVDELKDKLAESPEPKYITPDDDIARDRPAAEFKNKHNLHCTGWSSGLHLIGVIECVGYNLYVDSLGTKWDQCRVAVEG
jgi:hypothetical protein